MHPILAATPDFQTSSTPCSHPALPPLTLSPVPSVCPLHHTGMGHSCLGLKVEITVADRYNTYHMPGAYLSSISHHNGPISCYCYPHGTDEELRPSMFTSIACGHTDDKSWSWHMNTRYLALEPACKTSRCSKSLRSVQSVHPTKIYWPAQHAGGSQSENHEH